MKKFFIFIILLWAVGSSVAHAAAPRDWWVDIANDRAQDVKTFLRQGVDPNSKSPSGQPALMYAIRNGAWHAYDALLAAPAIKVNITNGHDETPLMYLAVVGQTQRALALIQRGADVNRLGWTPLHYAASTGKVATAKMLIAHEAIVNAPSPNGTTPLMMAAFSGSRDMVQLLLDAGADPTTRNLDGKSAADWARDKGFADLAGQLDAIAQKVTARRKAKRAEDIANQAQALPVGNGAQAAPDGTHGSVPGIDSSPANATPPSLPADQANGGAVQKNAGRAPMNTSGNGAGASGNEAATSGNGTSKYFNLQDVGSEAGH
jgi:hypothetical protein